VIKVIRVGLTGWTDHDFLAGVPSKHKLRAYSAHFPIVEVDTSFYAIQPARNVARWAAETPVNFGFIVKAYQGLTGHLRGRPTYSGFKEMFAAFRQSLAPLIDSGKLIAVLFQYPPWFDLSREHLDILRYTKAAMENIPAALEFRHQSWFAPHMREKTLSFMEREGWIHSICDEPQAGPYSVPTVLESTHSEAALVRFHGRNARGWNNSGGSDWRSVRYLYKYSMAELAEWKENLLKLEKSAKDIYVLFNNNSGGDAAVNARQLMELLNIDYVSQVPRQLSFFDESD
jgi:uncharacterized protein YecE (DUF72 family)